MNPPHQGRDGFTLIETLLVLALFGMLSAMLFPVLLKARRTAYKPVCSSNLRQLGMAIAQYAQDWDERYPTGADMHGAYFPRGAEDLDPKDLRANAKKSLLSDQLHSYAPNRKLWQCPSDHGLRGQYAALDSKGEVVVTDPIPNAYETLGTSYEYEGRLAGTRYGDGCVVGDYPSLYSWGADRVGVLKDMGNEWHGEGRLDPGRKCLNVLYADGHVAFGSTVDGIVAWVCSP